MKKNCGLRKMADGGLIGAIKGLGGQRQKVLDAAEAAAGLRAPVPPSALAPAPAAPVQKPITVEEAQAKAARFKFERENPGVPYVPPKKMASGGMITGRGGPTEDKELIRVSPGEFVLPADTVEKVGAKNLQRIVNDTHVKVPGANRGPDGLRRADDGYLKKLRDKAKNALNIGKKTVVGAVEGGTAAAEAALDYPDIEKPAAPRTAAPSSGVRGLKRITPEGAPYTKIAPDPIPSSAGGPSTPPWREAAFRAEGAMQGGQMRPPGGIAPPVEAVPVKDPGILRRFGGPAVAAGIEAYGAHKQAQRPGAIPAEEYAKGGVQLGTGLAGATAATRFVKPFTEGVRTMPYPGARLAAGAIDLGAAGAGYIGGSLGAGSLFETAGDRAAKATGGSAAPLPKDYVPTSTILPPVDFAAPPPSIPLPPNQRNNFAPPGAPVPKYVPEAGGAAPGESTTSLRAPPTPTVEQQQPDGQGIVSNGVRSMQVNAPGLPDTIRDANAAARAEMQAMDVRTQQANDREGLRLRDMANKGQLVAAKYEAEVAAQNAKRFPRDLGVVRDAALKNARYEGLLGREQKEFTQAQDHQVELAKNATFTDAMRNRDALGLRGTQYSADKKLEGDKVQAGATLGAANARASQAAAQAAQEQQNKNRNERDDWLKNRYTKTVDDPVTKKTSIERDPEKEQLFNNFVVSYMVNNPKFAGGKHPDKLTTTDLEPIGRAFDEQMGVTDAARGAGAAVTGAPTSATSAPIKWSDLAGKGSNIGVFRGAVAKLNPFNSNDPGSRSVTIRFDQGGVTSDQTFMLDDILKGDPKQAKALIARLPKDQADELTRMLQGER